MATTYKGRTSSRSRSTYGGFSSYLWGSPSNTWGGGYKKSNGRKTKKNGSGNPSAYRSCCNTFEQKIDSYKTLCAQAKGTGSSGKPSPSTLNSFANWINKGAIIQTVSKEQISRWARSTNKNFNPRNPSPTACKNVLTAKFGRSAIKAVACTKSGSFMVVTPPTVNGRSFSFPH